MNGPATKAPWEAGSEPWESGGPPPGTRPPLRRSRSDRVVCGVCGGLGRHLGIDPLLLRIAFVVLALADGVGILLYVLAVLAIPPERGGAAARQASQRDVELGALVVGGSLVVIGGILLVDRLVPGANRVVWPLVVIALGAAILLRGGRR